MGGEMDGRRGVGTLCFGPGGQPKLGRSGRRRPLRGPGGPGGRRGCGGSAGSGSERPASWSSSARCARAAAICSGARLPRSPREASEPVGGLLVKWFTVRQTAHTAASARHAGEMPVSQAQSWSTGLRGLEGPSARERGLSIPRAAAAAWALARMSARHSGGAARRGVRVSCCSKSSGIFMGGGRCRDGPRRVLPCRRVVLGKAALVARSGKPPAPPTGRRIAG